MIGSRHGQLEASRTPPVLLRIRLKKEILAAGFS